MDQYPPSIYMFKALSVLKSCETPEQLSLGERYVCLAKSSIMDTSYPDDLKDTAIQIIDDFYDSIKNNIW